MAERKIQKPLDPPMVPFAVGGMAIWAVLGVVMWATNHPSWAQICLAGFLWGIPGLVTMLRHDAKSRRQAGASVIDSTSPSS